MVWKENFSFSWPDSIPILIITKEIEHREKFERLERRCGKKFFINDFEVTLEFQEQSQRLMWAANQSLTLLTQTELKEILDIMKSRDIVSIQRHNEGHFRMPSK